MNTFDDQEEAPYPFSGACFACGLGSGKRKRIKWQSDRPNPLPIFEFADEFYTPILLPGFYLPLDLFMSEVIDDGIQFYTTEDPEVAKVVVAFLTHESFHEWLLTGIVPTLIRLIASRCYLLLARLTKDGYDPFYWKYLLDQNNNIANLFMAIAPFHEVVANMGNFSESYDNAQNRAIGKASLSSYYELFSSYDKIYGQKFFEVLRDFNFILKKVDNWFGPNPIQHLTIIALAEFIFLDAIDSSQISADLFTPPSLIPERRLRRHLKHFGLPYFAPDKQPSLPAIINFYTYDVNDITEKLAAIALGMPIADLKPRGKSPKTAVEQILFLAKYIPGFHEWLQCTDFHHWLRRRLLNGISDVQEMILCSGFDLPLIEAWQWEMSPFIGINFRNESTNEIKYYAFGKEREQFLAKMGKHMVSKNLIAYYLQANKPLGIWYAPACDAVTRAPITPTVHILGEDRRGVHNLLDSLHCLSVFESLRQQVGEGKGVSCVLRHQYGGGCCGLSKLSWSIYEAGEKAKEELGWQPPKWVEPECSKTDR